MGLKFRALDCKIALRIALADALKLMQETLYFDAMRKMPPEAAEELYMGDIMPVADYMAAYIIGGPWVAMHEWGTGSLMDRSNPAWSKYVNSSRFNADRFKHGLARVGRRPGRYIDIFGRERHSTGALQGINLEMMARRGALPDSFLPTPPYHTIQRAMEWMKKGEIQKILGDTVEKFPWHRFFSVTKDKG